MQIAKSLQKIPSSYIREILDAASSDQVISLAGGLPEPGSFPLDLMKPALENMTAIPEVFQYGNTAGYQPLLDYIRVHYTLPDDHMALVSTGSQQGIDLIARAFIDPGDKIVMEAPSYLGAMQVFGLSQADILSVEQNAEGPDLDALETCFAASEIKLFYAVPDFHNPTGVSWSLNTRKKVAELCQKYDVVLVEDAPYRELRFSGEMLPLVSSFCPDHSIVLRSYSKIASPGIRIGAVTGKQDYIRPLIKVKQGADLHSSFPMQALLLAVLQNTGFPAHLEKTRALYQQRYQGLMDILCEDLPEGCEVKPIEGGMFVWLKVPECDTLDLAGKLLQAGVAVVPSKVFYPRNQQKDAALRLNFTSTTTEEQRKAVKIMMQVIRTL